MRISRTLSGIIVAGLMTATLAACGGDDSDADGTESADGLENVDVYFGAVQSQGQFFAFYWAGLEQGFYKDVGLAPKFMDGEGSVTMSQQVASNQISMATEIGSPAVVSLAAAGGEVTVVGSTLPRLPLAVVSDRELQSPEDLRGLTIGVPPGGIDALLWSQFLAFNDISEDEVKTVNLDPDAVLQALASGQIDGLVSFDYTNIARLHELGVDAYSLRFQDWGIPIAPAQTVIVNSERLADDADYADVVSRFLEATEKSIEYAIENPEETAKAAVAAVPDSYNYDVTLEQLKAWAEIHEEYGPTEGSILATSPDDWAALVETFETVDLIEPGAVDPAELSSNELLGDE